MTKFLSFLYIVCLILVSCSKPQKKYLTISGEAQGSTFKITYDDSLKRDFSDSILTILQNFDNELSTYKPDSWISLFNKKNYTNFSQTQYVEPCLTRALYWKSLSKGLFDPTATMLTEHDSTSGVSLDSLLNKERTYRVIQEKKQVIKSDSSIKINMNAIAQGYSVDILCEFLDRKNIQNYFVEIGGELRVKGKNSKNQPWRIGIESPESTIENRDFQHIVELSNKSMATSGSYRKFIEKEGKKYSHAINPRTGKGVTHQLLSVTILDETCIDADALATTLLVMGYEQSIDFLTHSPLLKNASVMFIVEENDSYQIYYHGGFKKYLIQ